MPHKKCLNTIAESGWICNSIFFQFQFVFKAVPKANDITLKKYQTWKRNIATTPSTLHHHWMLQFYSQIKSSFGTAQFILRKSPTPFSHKIFHSRQKHETWKVGPHKDTSLSRPFSKNSCKYLQLPHLNIVEHFQLDIIFVVRNKWGLRLNISYSPRKI